MGPVPTWLFPCSCTLERRALLACFLTQRQVPASMSSDPMAVHLFIMRPRLHRVTCISSQDHHRKTCFTSTVCSRACRRCHRNGLSGLSNPVGTGTTRRKSAHSRRIFATAGYRAMPSSSSRLTEKRRVGMWEWGILTSSRTSFRIRNDCSMNSRTGGDFNSSRTSIRSFTRSLRTFPLPKRVDISCPSHRYWSCGRSSVGQSVSRQSPLPRCQTHPGGDRPEFQ